MLPFSAGPRGHGYPSLMICPLNAAFFALSLANMQGFTTVSYTHLDVYKRQVLMLTQNKKDASL